MLFFFFLYKHQYSGLCFQPSWRLHLTFTSKEQEIHVGKLPFPLCLIHPQFTSNSCISWLSETCWNQYRFSRGSIQGPIFSDLPGWIVLEWWQQPPEGLTALRSLLLPCPPAWAVPAAHQPQSVLLAEPSFLLWGAVISHLNYSSTSTVAVFFTTIRADISCLHKEGTSISLVSGKLSNSLSRGRWLQIKLAHRWDYKCNSSIMRIKKERDLRVYACDLICSDGPKLNLVIPMSSKRRSLQVQPLEEYGCEEETKENKRQVFSLSC